MKRVVVEGGLLGEAGKEEKGGGEGGGWDPKVRGAFGET